MASEKQRAAARRNVKKAQAGAKRKKTLKHLSAKTKTALGKEANNVRKGEAKMGKDELRAAIARAR
jgi:hypothetical protein